MNQRVWLLAQGLAVASTAAVFLYLATLRLRVVLLRRARPARGASAARGRFADRSARDLEAWIGEVEREDRAAAPQSGSEAWWRAYAAGGGRLPEPADSRRRSESGSGRVEPAFSGSPGTSRGARGLA